MVFLRVFILKIALGDTDSVSLREKTDLLTALEDFPSEKMTGMCTAYYK